MWTTARKVTLVAAVAIVVLAMWMLTDVLMVFFASVLFAVFLTGPTVLLMRYASLSRGFALTLVLAALVALLGAAGWFLGRELASQFDTLRDSAATTWDEWSTHLAEHPWGQALAQQQAEGEARPTSLLPSSSTLIRAVTGTLQHVAGALGGVVVTIVLGIYIAVDPGLYKHGLLRLFPPPKRPRMREILEALWATLNGWLIGRGFSMLVIGIGTGIGLWLIGLPMALALGLLAFAVTFVPYVGPLLSVLPAVLVASSMGRSELLWVLALYGGLQFLETYLLTPLVEHHAVEVPPALSIGAQLAGGVLFGALGLLFATPIAAVAMVLVKMLYVEDTLGEAIETP